MVSLVEGVTEGGQVLPDAAERGVRSSIFGQTAVALGETAASAGRTLGGVDDATEITFGASPVGSGRYDTGSGDVELGGGSGSAGSPIGQLAQTIISNLPAITSGIALLVIIYTLGRLFTFNFNIGGGE